MKSEAGFVEQPAPNGREENLQPIVTLILETMRAFGKPYGQNYVAQFLTADKFLIYRHPDHKEIPTYGKLGNRNTDDLFAIIHFLVDQGLIAAREPDFLTVEMTIEGQFWLANPQEMNVQKQRVRYSPLEKYLRNAIREQRRQLADRHGIKPWDVITDYVMDRIVLSKPLDLNAISRVQGFDTLKCERFGIDFVKIVQDVIEHYEDFQRASLQARIKGGSYPRVKSLFLDNVTVPEIAQLCDIRISTVCSYLRDLHEVNHIDLVPWIERNINSKSLYRGVEYFDRVSRASLSEAHAVLGLDYNTLLFCRLYARDKRQQQKEARLMAS